MILTKSLPRAMSAVALLAALLVLTLGIAGLTFRGLLLVILVFLTIVPMEIKYLRYKLDWFEPLVLANVSMGIMFIGRPLADIVSGTTSHLGQDITGTFDKALLLVTIAVGFFQLGYHSPFPSRLAKLLPRPRPFNVRKYVFAALLFFAIGGGLFSLFLRNEGGIGTLLSLLSGRNAADNALFLGSTGYFYNGILMWAASALIFFAIAVALKRRMYFLAFLVVTIPLVIFFGSRGTRSQLLPLIVAVPAFWFLWRRRRPSASAILLATIGVTALLGWARDIRTAESAERADAVSGFVFALGSPVQEFSKILNGADAEMFDALASELQVVPERVPYRPAGTLSDLVIRAIPRPLWPNKPLETNDRVVVALWPAHYESSRAAPAFSVVGSFYADSGFVGAALGMFGIGIVLSAIWRWYLKYSSNIDITLIYCMALPFTVILLRGTLADTLSRMLFLVIPLLVAMWASRFRLGSKRLPKMGATGAG